MKKWIFTSVLIFILIVSFYAVKDYQNNNPSVIAKNNLVQSSEQTKTNEGTSNLSQGSSLRISPNSIKISEIDFKLKDLNGNDVSLSQFKGKRVFLNFWATWCPPCRGEMPDIEKVYQETKDSDLVILAVNLGEKKDTVKSFVDQNKYHFTVLLDSTEDVATKYNIRSIPTSFFIDKDGNIVTTQVGAMDKNQMDSYISKIDKK